MANDSVDEYFDAFGPFAAVFKPLGDDLTPYLSLLHLRHEGTEKVIALIRKLTRQPNASQGIVNLLRDSDWRPHLVGVAAAHFATSDELFQEAWRAIDAGSWVTPQIAAILSLNDGNFVERSINRLKYGCPLVRTLDQEIDDPLQRHISQGPAGDHERSAKAAASLYATLCLDHPSDDRVRALAMDKQLETLIMADFDDSSNRTISWRERFLQNVNE